MKLALFLMALIGSLASAECPILENIYFCKAANAKQASTVRTITQFDDGKNTFIVMKVQGSDGSAGTVEYVTDGKPYTRQEKSAGGKALPMTETAVCADGALVIKGNTQVPVFGTLEYTSEFRRNENNDLEIHIVTKVGPGGSDDIVKCSLLNPP